MDQPGFDAYPPPPNRPTGPVIVSVPHAGRDYPPALLGALKGAVAGLRALEDRHVDAVALAACRGEAMLIQRRGRAWIDLNRGEDERDPQIDEGARPSPAPSLKLRSGLGLVPRRANGSAELWRRRFSDAEIAARIANDHRPYHAALAAALASAHAAHGMAVLVDLHSMPPLGAGGAAIVIGDRFGRAAGDRFVARAQRALAAAGLSTAVNTPYAGGHIVERHGDPAAGIHAIQVEIDRRLYLDARLDAPGPGLARIAAAVAAMLAALADEATATGREPLPVAAE